MSELNLLQLRAQRQVRLQRRNNFKAKISDLSNRVPPQIPINKQISPIIPVEKKVQNLKSPQQQIQIQQQQLLLQQNSQLKQQYLKLQALRTQKIQTFYKNFQTVKTLYMNKIKQISSQGKKTKQDYIIKLNKLNQQIIITQSKNQQLKQTNKKIEQDLQKSTQITFKYADQIQKQYSQKLLQFQQTYNKSCLKIKQLQQKSNNQQFIQATLKNQQLIQQIQQNISRNSQDIDRIYVDYQELLKTKQQIYIQLIKSNKSKQKQLANCQVLQQKLKVILKKLGEQRQIYLDQNKKMNQQLLGIQGLLTKVMESAVQ